MNTSSTNPTTAFSRWTHFSRLIRVSLGFSLLAGLAAALLLVIFMVGCKEEGPGIVNVCPAATAPTVIRTSPANGVTNEPLNKISNANESAIAATVNKISAISKKSSIAKSASVAAVKVISATFSTPMDPNSISTATFTVWQGTTPILGGVSYTDTTALFVVPSGLDPNLTYTCRITTGAMDVAGTALANIYVWSFTTSAAAVVTLPAVSSTDPVNAATGVALSKQIAATFSKTMDASTFTTATFTLTQGTTSVPGFVSYSGTTATFALASNLMPSTTYTATITTGAKDLAGNALANNYVWSFTTGAAAVVTLPTVSSTDPVNAATGVALSKQIAATFSKAMDASTFTTATFTLKQGTTSVPGFVSYSGTTATFVLASNLMPSTTYTATITTGAKDLAGNALASNYVWSFTTGASAVVTLPTVSSTDPANAATGVPLNQKIAATFSAAMDASTFTSATFTLTQGTTSVSGFVSYSGITAIFAPSSNLAPNTAYTATIKTNAKDLTGNALASNYVWSFTTGASAVVTLPTVSSTDPANAATGVPLNQAIAATFSRTMDATTITASTFTVTQGTTSFSGFVSYSGITAIFTHATNFLPNTVYTATITSGAKDLAGNALANNFVWTFTTGAAAVVTPPTVSSTDPVNVAIGVPLNQKIAATFSKTMDATTIQTSTFRLMQGTTLITGFVSYSGLTATFAPASNLAPNSTYIATISTGAKDLAGNALANDFVWSFTTGAAVVTTSPIVISTDPLNAAIGVPLNQKIAATFNRSMDPATIHTSTFTLLQGITPISGFVSYSGVTALFAPLSNLAPNTIYTATITVEAKDLAGNPIASNYVWNFTTGTTAVAIPPVVNSTDPANTDTCVALDKQITATFSKTMDATTIQTSTFRLMQGTTKIDGFVFYSGVTATFVPASNLAANTLYTATITTAVMDLAGNPLASNYVWSFTTVVPYTVSLSSNSSNGGTTSGSGTFNSCSSVTISATPNNGYTFTNWTENGTVVTTNASYIFTLSGNRTFVANFAAIPPTQYSVTLSSFPIAGGTTSGGGSYNSGSSVTVTATPGGGYVFNNWTEGGNPVSANASYTFTISGNRTFVANFLAIPPTQYSVTLSSFPIAGGTTSGGGSFNSGSSVTVIATPGSGYVFTNWTESGNPVSANASYTFTISGNRTFVANFIPIQYTVSLSSIPLAGGTTSGGGSYNSGSSVTVIATPGGGYVFTNWTEAGNPVSANASYTFTISGNRTLVANFIPIQYTVSLSSIPLAGGTTSGGGSYNSGSSVTVIATPGGGYVFTNWTEAGNPVSANASYTFTISGNRTLVANFALGLAPGAVPLLSASTYGILSSSAITDASGASVIWGDVAMYPGTANGLLPAQVHGAIHIADGVAQSVYTDLTAAYHFAKNLAPGTTVPDGQDLGTLIVGTHAAGHLPPGTYTSSSSLLINTPVVLDGGGNANAVWVFQIGSSLTTYSGAPGGNVTLTGSAQQKNVFFVPTAAASIGSGTTFYGNILAGGDLTSAGGATIYGRLLAGAIGASTLALDGAASTVFVPAP